MRTANSSKMVSACLLVTLSLWMVPGQGSAQQDLMPIYSLKDMAYTETPPKFSEAEELTLHREVWAAAHQYWRQKSTIVDIEDNNGCYVGGMYVTSAAQGSFTKPHSNQKALIYDYCVYGAPPGNESVNGMVVLDEDGYVAAHIVYIGTAGDRILAVPDILGNGRSGIAIRWSYAWQGEVAEFISLVGLSKTEVRKIGKVQTYDDICGLCRECGLPDRPPCDLPCRQMGAGKARAYSWFVRAGPTPVFYRQVFMREWQKGFPETGEWVKSGKMEPTSLGEGETEDRTEYVRLK